MRNGGLVWGDNRDVRPPDAEENWDGGIVIGAGGGSADFLNVTTATIRIEGAFFDDGEFAGATGTQLFERTVAKAKAHLEMAEIASKPGKIANKRSK